MEKPPFLKNNESEKKEDTKAPAKGFFKKALVTVAALTIPHQAMSPEKKKIELPQEKQTTIPVSVNETIAESKMAKAAHFFKDEESMEQSVKDSIPSKADVENEYNKNKEKNDSAFQQVFTLHDNDSAFVSVEVKGIKNGKPIELVVKIKHKNPDGSIGSKEVFSSSEDLSSKYPSYQKDLDSTISSLYSQHVDDLGWAPILSEKEKTLSSEVLDSYTPSEEEMNIIRKDAKDFKKGINVDGFDNIYLHYTKTTKTHEGLYKFYQKYKTTPYLLGKYMRQKHFLPLIEK